MLVVLLLGILLLREPRFAHAEDLFLRWLLEHSRGSAETSVPLTVVEIGQNMLPNPPAAGEAPDIATGPHGNTTSATISPLEFALFLQSVLDFQPGVVAFENILRWRDRDKDQEQVFLDQAMRVPKLLLASELSETSDPDANWGDIRGFPNVIGRRGELQSFSGIGRQPNEDLQLISTQGFTNLPDEISSAIRVPLLFLYRGEVIPSFPLQAILLWQRITPAEVQVVLGAYILLPHGRKIPINADGTLLVDPNAARQGRRMSLNELLLAAQQREAAKPGASPATGIPDQIVLARTPNNPLSPPDLFAATIATIQGNNYLHRISRVFDCAILLCLGATVGTMRRTERFDLVLCGIAFTAAYCLVALGAVARWHLWLPGILPLGAVWVFIFAAFFFPRKAETAGEGRVTLPPPLA